MVMNLVLVCMVCQRNKYVIPKSISREGLGYKSYLIKRIRFSTVSIIAAISHGFRLGSLTLIFVSIISVLEKVLASRGTLNLLKQWLDCRWR